MLAGSIIANIPGFILLIYVIREGGKENIPGKVLRQLVIVGFLLMLPVVLLQTVVGLAGEWTFLVAHPLLSEIIMSGIRLAFVEELCKYFATKAISWRGDYFRDSYQGMLLPTITALSFGILENVMFVALSLSEMHSSFWLIVLTRAFIGAPGHGAYGIIMGIFYWKAKAAQIRGELSEKRKNLILAVVVPGCIHGLYDWLASSQIIKIGDTNIITTVMVILDFSVIVYAYYRLFRQKKEIQRA